MSRIHRLLPLLFLSGLALAQTAPDTTIRVTSRIVYVDIVVRDSYGRIVRGLTEKDFHVSEDGKPETIDYFRDHTHDLAANASPPSTPRDSSSLEFSNVTSGGDGTNSINIILFDFQNTAPQDQLYARKQMIRFLENLPPGRQTALFVLDARLRMLQSFTGSTDLLVAAANQMKVEASSVQTLGQHQQDDDFARSFAAAMGRSASGRNVVAKMNDLAAPQDFIRSAAITQGALKELAAATSGYPGRKNLYWLADDFPVYGGPALEINDLSSEMAMSINDFPGFTAGTNKIADAQIAIYPISLAGLEVADAGPETAGRPGRQQFAKQFNDRSEKHALLEDIADNTGGKAYFGTNDFAGALQRGFEDGANYYTLAYRPENKNWNSQFRKIHIKLGASGYSLSYRRGYFATPEDTPQPHNGAQELNAALQPDTPDSTMLLLKSKVLLPDAQHSAVRVDSVIDPVNVAFSTDSRGRRHAQLLVSLIAIPEIESDGKAKADKQPPSLPQTSGAYVVDLDPQAFQKLFTSGMPMHQELTLPPGRYRLRLGVSDLGSHRIGTLDMPIEVVQH